MLTSLEVHNPQAAAISVPAGGGTPETDLFQILNVDGLGPVTATIGTVPNGSGDGEVITSSTTPKRNIVVDIGFNPDWVNYTYEDLRKILYAYFMPKASVRLVFSRTNRPDVQIYGVVESCVPNIFTKDPAAQVSILCENPYFVDVTPTVVPGTVRSMNDVTNFATILYSGDVETGYTLDVKAGTAPTYNGVLNLIHRAQKNQIFYLSNVDILSSQYVTLNSVNGDKYVTKSFVPAGPRQTLLGSLGAGSIWPKLQPGSNQLMVQTASNPGQVWTMTYYAKHGGL